MEESKKYTEDGSVLRVYHTGFHVLREPDIRIGRKNADFGQGFYLSLSDAFAGKWARENRAGEVYVNCYELSLAGLRVLRLSRDERWFDYISHNRALRGEDYPEADVVIGPIANDTIYDTFGILTSGYLDPALSLSLLRLGPCFEQLVVKTERARAQLRWLSARTLGREELSRFSDELLREQEDYQRAIAAILEEE